MTRSPETACVDHDVAAVRRQMFLDFCALLEAQRIAYVILHGYLGYPDRIDSDVDFQVSAADFDRLPALFASQGCIPGATLVQVLRHEASSCYYVFARQVGAKLAYLHADAVADYRLKARLWMRSTVALDSRRKATRGFWIPSPAVEFEYYFIKRLVDKASVEEQHVRAFARNCAEDPEGCLGVLNRFLPAELVDATHSAIQRCDVAWWSRECQRLRAFVVASAPQESAAERLCSRLNEVRRVALRIVRPAGLVVGVLGPDGSGKTTMVEHLEREVAPAFRRVRRFHFRPWFGKPGGRVVSDPHAQPPRTWLVGLVKTWMYIVDYWLGWVSLVMPAKIRSTLVLFDRYYHDSVVDSARYRLPRYFGPSRWFAFLVPQPDMWLVLHASPATLIDRKGELDYDTANVLAESYRALCRRLPNASLIDTEQELESALGDVVKTVRLVLEQRVAASGGRER